jgi:hypothetical protein
MENDRAARSETLEISNFHDEPSPGKDVKRTSKNLVESTNPKKKLFESP